MTFGVIVGWALVIFAFALVVPNSSKGPHDKWDARDLKNRNSDS